MKKQKETSKQAVVSNMINRKVGRPFKEVVPALHSKLARENIPIPKPDSSSVIRDYSPYAEPFEVPPEWSEESLKQFNKDFLENQETHSSSVFSDPSHDTLLENLPLSFTQGHSEVRWVRAEKLVRNYTLDREIQNTYPRKNHIKMRREIRENYTLDKQTSEKQVESEEEDLSQFLEDDDEKRRRKLIREFYKFLEQDLDLKVVNSVEREETEEEFKKRKEEAQLALAKAEANKAGKKAVPNIPKEKKNPKTQINIQPCEEERLKVREARPRNISIVDQVRDPSTNFTSLTEVPTLSIANAYTKWVSSVLQAIQDSGIHDASTGHSIWKNIYPQKDDMPVYNPRGHYIAKLYFMGKPRKVEVDDLFPCNKDEEWLMPKSEDINELWPAIFTKALMKLSIYKVRHPKYFRSEEGADISLFYALTGYISEQITPTPEDNPNFISNLVEKLLKNEVYLNKKKVLVCLSRTENASPIESFEKVHEANRQKMQSRFANSPQIHKFTSEMNLDGMMNSKLLKRNTMSLDTNFQGLFKSKKSFINDKLFERKTSVVSKTSLKLTRMMTRKESAQPEEPHPSVTMEELLAEGSAIFADFAYSTCDFFDNYTFNMGRVKPLDFSDLKQKIRDAHVSYKQLSREEKKDYMANLFEIKKEQKIEKQRRIEELTQEGEKVNLVKLKSGVSGAPKLQFYVPFTEEEITVVKKCLLNDWHFPPVEYFDRLFQGSELDIKNDSLDKKDKKDKKDKNTVRSNFAWSKDTYMSIIGPYIHKYAEEITLIERQTSGTWLDYSEFENTFNTFVVLHNPSFYKGGRLVSDCNWTNYSQDSFVAKEDNQVFHLSLIKDSQETSSSVILVFTPNIEKNISSVSKIHSYANFQLASDSGEVVEDDIILNSLFSTYSCAVDQPNCFLVLTGGVFPIGFTLEILSEFHSIEAMSHNTYMKNHLLYQLADKKAEHPIIEKNKFYLLSRIVFKTATHGKFKMSFKYPDKYAKKFIELYINKNDKSKYQKTKINFNELVSVEPNEYIFTISVKCAYTLVESAFEVEFLYSDREAKVEFVDHIEPFEQSEKTNISRHGIIFKEFIYSPDHILASLDIRVKNTNSDADLGTENRMHLELYKVNSLNQSEMNLDKTLLTKWEFFNGISVHNILFEGVAIIEKPQDKKSGAKADKDKDLHNANQTTLNLPYLLICYFDMTGPLTVSSEVTWVLRVFSTDTLVLAKDTTKEDSEKALKDSWETSELGRAERAKKSRAKFLVAQKLERGEKMSPEEEKLLQEERERKPAINSQVEAISPGKKGPGNQATGKKADPKKEEKKANTKDHKDSKDNKDKTQNEASQVTVIISPRSLPQPDAHTSDFIKSFLSYAYQERTILYDNALDQEEKLINDEDIQKQKFNFVLKEFEDYENKRQLEFTEGLSTKTDFADHLKMLLKTSSGFRKEVKEDKEVLLKAREIIKADFQSKIDLEKNIHDFVNLALTGANIDSHALVHAVTLYQEGRALIDSEQEGSYNNYSSNPSSNIRYLVRKLFDFISAKKDESIKADLKKMTVKDKQSATKLLEEIEHHKWNISEDTLKRLHDLVK